MAIVIFERNDGASIALNTEAIVQIDESDGKAYVYLNDGKGPVGLKVGLKSAVQHINDQIKTFR